jgi:thiamine biosynthesis protein ThiS
MVMMKKFFVNGRKYETSGYLTISTLLYYFNYSQTLFVLEYNSLICDQKNWSKIEIKDNDKIEIGRLIL